MTTLSKGMLDVPRAAYGFGLEDITTTQTEARRQLAV
jgi:hypothetical protein